MHPIFPLATLPATMQAMVTTGQGGYEQLVYRAVPMPVLQPGEVLLQVLAAGINNTDINTRLGWYGVAAHVAGRPAPGARAEPGFSLGSAAGAIGDCGTLGCGPSGKHIHPNIAV